MPSNPPRQLTGQALSSKLDEILKEPIPQFSPSPIYMFSLIISAITIIILPIIYIALIGAVGYATYYHATEHYSIFDELSGGRWGIYIKLVIYLAPLLMGVMLIGFMLKPFIAPPHDAQLGPTLSQAEEPVIYNLVALLCEKLGAPMPNRIDVNADVNASASFRRGWLSFFGSDLVLTIGMPLVSGFTVRELGGVIAHELGHFRQGSAMRLNFIVISVNRWFARVVYQRDEWDYWLQHGDDEEGATSGLFRMAMLLLVWLTRRILWALMMISHGISCFVSRQMEYDADKSSCAIAGTQQIKTGLVQMRVLNDAMRDVLVSPPQDLKDNQLYDDLPGYMGVRSKMLKDESREKLTEKLMNERVGPFSTHPSFKSIVRHAERLDTPGILNLDTPASTLFHRYDMLCKAVTYAWYADQIGPAASRFQLVSTKPLIDQMQTATTQISGVSEFLHGAYDPTRPPRINISSLAKPDDPKATAKRLHQVNQQYHEKAPQYRDLLNEREEAEAEVMRARSVVRCFQSGLQIDPDYLPSGMQSRAKALAAHHAADMRFHAIEEKLEPYDQLVTERIKLAIQLMTVPAVAKQLPKAKSNIKTIKKATPGLAKLARHADLIQEIRHDLQLLQFMKRIQKDIPRHPTLNESINDTCQLIRKSILTLQAKTVAIHGQKPPEIEIEHHSAFSNDQGPIMAKSVNDQQELDISILTTNQDFQSKAITAIVKIAQEIEAKLPGRN